MSSQQQVISSLERQCDSELSSKTDSVARITQIDSRLDKLNSEITSERTSNEDILTTIREYDTDKPIDENTGRPPLKKETTQERRKVDAATQKQLAEQTSDKHSEKAADISKQAEDNALLREQSAAKTDSDTRVKVDEKRGLNTFQQILCSVGLLAVVVALIWLGRKLRRRLLKLK